MPLQLQKGHTYNPGDVVDAPDLNSLVDAGTVLKGAITEATTAAPTTPASDWVLYYNNAVGDLRKCHISQLPVGVTSVGLTVAPTSVFADPGISPITATGTYAVSLKNQNHNKVLISPADGSLAQPAFRTLVPADMTVPTVQITVVDIDWSLGNVFDKTLTVSPTTFTFSNVDNGQTIRVRVRQTAAGTAAVNWDPSPLTIIWTDGITPVLPTIPNGYGIFVFTSVVQSGVYRIHGHLEQVLNPAVVASQTANAFFAGPTSGAAATPTFRAIQLVDLPIGTSQAANTFFAGPESGAAATPTFRDITPADTILFSEVVSPGNIIDCNVGNVFRKELLGTAGTATLHLKNGALGQKISVYVIQFGAPGITAVAWTTDDPIPPGQIRWPSAVGHHTMSTGPVGTTDIVNFLCMGSGLYYGTFDKDFVP